MSEEFYIDSSLTEFYEIASSPEQLFSQERYINEQFLAEGSIKQVYKVTDTYCERDVALARIKEDIFDFQQTVDFIREVQVTSRFEHPHIIRIYNIGITDGVPWFTMELTSGTTLNDVIRNGELHFSQKLDILLDLCSAIQYAHERDVLHLDIKPDNISVGSGGQILVGDWGIASSLVVRENDDITGSDTMHGYMKGTPGFMAPEQIKGDYLPSPQTDIYAIGSLFYHLLTGEHSVIGDTTHALITSTVNGRLKDMKHASIPARLGPIISKCLSTIPSQRYSSILELQSDIEKFRAGFATQAESTSLSSLAKLFIQRHKRGCIAAALLVLSVIGAVFFYIQEIKERELIAETERAKTLELLERVQENERHLKHQAEDYAYDLLGRSRAQLSLGNVERAYKSAASALELFPEDPQVQSRYGFLSFLTQRFKQAATYLPTDDPRQKRQLIRELAASQLPNAEDPLTLPELFLALYKKSRTPDASYFFLHDSKGSPKEQHAQLVKILLERENKIDGMFFDWNPKTQVLDISGNGDFKTLIVKETKTAPGYNIVEGLPIKKLIIDDAPRNREKAASYIPRKNSVVLLKKVK